MLLISGFFYEITNSKMIKMKFNSRNYFINKNNLYVLS